MAVFVFYQRINEMGCASFTLDTSVFFKSTNERFLKESLTVKGKVTEEGTGDRFKQNTDIRIEQPLASPLKYW